MSTLAHISDPHFGTERPLVVAALQRWIVDMSPELVILSGDITQRARRSEFAAAKQFIGQLRVPTLVIPGNHDIALFNLFSRVMAPYAGFRKACGRKLEPTWESPEWLIIGLNTTRRWRHTDGQLSRRQIARVAARLRSASPAQRKVVVTHQPLLVTRFQDRQNLIHGHEQAVRAWSAAGADLLLGGHIHLPYVRSLRTDYPDLARETWVVQAGTCVSQRVRGTIPNSVNLLRYGDAQMCQVERWDYHLGDACFRRESVQQLRMDERVGVD